MPGPVVDLDNLLNVSTSAKADRQVVMWDNANSLWVNEEIVYGTDISGTPVLGLTATTNNYDDLDNLPTFVGGTNVTIVPVNTAGQIEYTFNASGGTGTGDATTTSPLSQFDTVRFPTALVAGEYLRWDGSFFENAVISLNDIDEMSVVSPLANNILQYNIATGKWNAAVNEYDSFAVTQLGAVGGGALAFANNTLSYASADLSGLAPLVHTHVHTDITDWDTASAAAADTQIALADIGDLNNVDATAPNSGEALVWNGSTWIPTAVSTAGAVTSVNTFTGDVVLSYLDVGALSVTGELQGTFLQGKVLEVEGTDPIVGDVLTYVSTDGGKWITSKTKYTNLDVTGATLNETPGISNLIVPMGEANSILVGSGTDYVPGFGPDEHASMTFQGDPTDGDYYMVLAMPCAAEIQSITAVTVGSGATINYQVFKGELTGLQGAVHAVTTATTTKADVASITNGSLAIGDEMWVALDTSSSVGQFSITVNYRPTNRFVT